jgi:hypothetical protein
MVKMFGFLADEGYKVDIPALTHTYPEVGWHDREAWAATQDWSSLMAPDREPAMA